MDSKRLNNMPVGKLLDIYEGKDPSCIAAYSVAEAAHWLALPATTVRTWVLGRHYPTDTGKKFSRALIPIADRAERLLSFQNLIEAYVLGAIRRRHRVKMAAICKALNFLAREFDSKHPLSDEQMMTDGTSLLVEKYGNLINASEAGQLEMRELLLRHLDRIERSPTGLPVRLFPFTSHRLEEDRLPVAIDPRVQFGRPCLAGTGIPTDVIAERWKAGDTIAEIAKDYGTKAIEIEEAIRYEEQAVA